MNDLHSSYRQQMNELAQNYFVRDFIPEQARFLFLLESPHVQELLHGAPVSGASGISMTTHLFGERYAKMPLGRIVKKNWDEDLHRPSIDQVALMNVCQIPMQPSAYANADVQKTYAELLAILSGIRTANARHSFSDPAWNAVQEVIAHALHRKLERLQGRPLFVVPCGRFAQKFFALADIRSESWTIINGIPHPSYNNWSKPEYANSVTKLCREFGLTHS